MHTSPQLSSNIFGGATGLSSGAPKNIRTKGENSLKAPHMGKGLIINTQVVGKHGISIHVNLLHIKSIAKVHIHRSLQQSIYI